jgi:GTPase Era involved in 16S rRNA processing
MKTLEQFLLTREDLAHKMAKLSGILGRIGLSERQAILEELEEECQDLNFRVLISGEFKRGKSCLVNSLLGEKILPMKIAPCTSTITEVHYGDTPKLTIETPEQSIDKPFEDLFKYCSIQGHQSLPESERPIEKVIIEYPSRLSHQALTFIDSPGLNEDWNRTRTSLREIAQADVLILVLSCEMALSQSEQLFIQTHLLPYTDRLFFLWNRADAIWDKPVEQEALEKRSQKHLQQYSNRIFYVSAREGLIGQLTEDDTRWTKSQIKSVLQSIEEYVIQHKADEKLERLWRRALQETNYTLQQLLPRMTRLLSLPMKSLLEIKVKLLELTETNQTLQSEVRNHIAQYSDQILTSIEETLDTFITNIPSNITKDFSSLQFEPRLSRQEREDIIIDWFNQWLQQALHVFTQSSVRTALEEQVKGLKDELDRIRQQAQRNIDTLIGEEDDDDLVLFSGQWVEDMGIFISTATSLLLLNINKDRVAQDLLKVRAIRGWLIGSTLSDSDGLKLANQLKETIQNERQAILDTQRSNLSLSMTDLQNSIFRELHLVQSDLSQQIERVIQLHTRGKQDTSKEQHMLQFETLKLSLHNMHAQLKNILTPHTPK